MDTAAADRVDTAAADRWILLLRIGRVLLLRILRVLLLRILRVPLLRILRVLLRILTLRDLPRPRERGCASDIVTESSKRGSVVSKQRNEIGFALLVARVIDAAIVADAHRFTVPPEIPHHAPWVKSGLRARVSAGTVGVRLGGAFVGDHAGILRRSTALSRLEDVIHIVVDVVIDLVAENARKLVPVLEKRQQRGRHVDVAAGHGKCVWGLLVQQYEMERRKVLPIGDRGDGFSDRVDRAIERRLRRDDLAALQIVRVSLPADLDLPALLSRVGVRPRRHGPEAQDHGKGGERSQKDRHCQTLFHNSVGAARHKSPWNG